MTRRDKAVMLANFLHKVEFEKGVDRTWFDDYCKERFDILKSSEETSPEWTSAYMDLYNLKQSILEYQNK